MRMRSGDVVFNSSKTAFTSPPTKGMNPSWNPLTNGPLIAFIPANSSAERLASAARSPTALNTTQWNTEFGYWRARCRIVPPQPISMSSECAPRHKTCSGKAESRPKLRECTRPRGVQQPSIGSFRCTSIYRATCRFVCNRFRDAECCSSRSCSRGNHHEDLAPSDQSVSCPRKVFHSAT